MRFFPALILAFLFTLFCNQSHAQLFPLYDRAVHGQDDPTTETWVLYPFYKAESTSSTLQIALHPLFSWTEGKESKRRDFDILWPIFTHRYRPERQSALNYSSNYLFPFYFDRSETRFGGQHKERLVLPFYFAGRQGERGRYTIIFPIIWYAHNARLTVPLFPPREQTFAAIFPLVGDFRGYWNRDRIRFFLWPLFVHSNEGKGEDFNEVHSFIWPIFAKYGGHNINGIRIFPLFAWAEKENEYRRISWLWPLGHYRTGRISKTNPEQQNVIMFIPFFAKFRQPNIKLDLIFPFYGRLEVGHRISQGYFLALYNRETNTRRGTREDRYGLFIVRRRTYLPGYDPENVDPNATVGGGVFPFYTRTYNARRIRKNILWPIFSYRFNRHAEYTFERKYVVPFYSDRKRVYNNGEYVSTGFIFPFVRSRKSLSDVERRNYLHLFFYSDIDAIDRLYAPLWTFWEKRENLRTGEVAVRVFKNASHYEKFPDGTERHRLKLFFVEKDSTIRPDGTKVGKTKILFGLVQRTKDEDGRSRISPLGL